MTPRILFGPKAQHSAGLLNDRSYPDDRRAVHGVPVARSSSATVGLSNRYSAVVGSDRYLCGQGEEILAVPPGVGGHAYDSVLRKVALVVERGNVGQVDARDGEPTTAVERRQGGKDERADGANRMAASSGSGGGSAAPWAEAHPRERASSRASAALVIDVHGGALVESDLGREMGGAPEAVDAEPSAGREPSRLKAR